MKTNQNKTSMAKAMGPFRYSQPLLGSPAPGAMYRLNPSLIGPDHAIFSFNHHISDFD